MKSRIVVGSRSSRLAQIQAEWVMTKIIERHPQLEIIPSHIATRGDSDHYTPFDKMESGGVFVKELETALLEGEVDLAVHSLKDMPTQVPAGLCLAAVTERLDPRDVLVSRGRKLAELAAGARIGTSSPRRAIQLGACRPDLEVCGLRGNVDTRLRKVANGDLDGIVVAAAALKRLGCEDRISEYLPVRHFLPSVGQGALALETRYDDSDMSQIIASLNHLPTWQSITAERALLRALGGGCRAPIAALGVLNGSTLSLEGMVAGVSTGRILRSSEEGTADAPEQLGARLAQRLVALGAEELIAEAGENESR